jgi:hypothetical protein
MLTATDTFTFSDGSQYTVISSPDDPNSVPLVMEMTLQPDCLAPPPHVHPHSSDTFEVLDGVIEVRADTIRPAPAPRPPMAILAALGRAMRVRVPQ